MLTRVCTRSDIGKNALYLDEIEVSNISSKKGCPGIGDTGYKIQDTVCKNLLMELN
jgi:hypothetical protein